MEKQDWLDIVKKIADIMGEKDWLDIADIVIIPMILALLALLWPAIQNWHRRRIFTKLIIRELSEISPYPKKPDPNNDKLSDWSSHCQKKFIHKEIFDNPNENRDFILSLDPDLVYYISQLWGSLKNKNASQWCYSLQELTLFIEYYHPIALKDFEFGKRFPFLKFDKRFPFIKTKNYSEKYKEDIREIYIKWVCFLNDPRSLYQDNNDNTEEEIKLYINTRHREGLERTKIKRLNNKLRKEKQKIIKECDNSS